MRQNIPDYTRDLLCDKIVPRIRLLKAITLVAEAGSMTKGIIKLKD